MERRRRPGYRRTAHPRHDEPSRRRPAFPRLGSFIWYRDIARLLRERLPDAAGKVRTRAMPDLAVKLLARRSPQMAMLRHELGRKRLVDSGKARTLLGWHPRPTEQTIIDTATALVAKNALSR
jgi:dihydroflavonol-4-reductase